MSQVEVDAPGRGFPGPVLGVPVLGGPVLGGPVPGGLPVVRTQALGARRNSYGLHQITMNPDSPLYSGLLSKALSWSAENILSLPESRAEEESPSPGSPSPGSPSPGSPSPGSPSPGSPSPGSPSPGSPSPGASLTPPCSRAASGAGLLQDPSTSASLVPGSDSQDPGGDPGRRRKAASQRGPNRSRWEQEEKEEIETRAVATSPDGRYLKFNIEIGRGSFKTVYKGLDTETTVEVAWCELQVRST
ncbi:hypothetical protein NHX12_024782 [Muraenolepis orangiensis]|uniref:Uncharacterized protein n=1 Tax=Muraenolepis orangiensis TaxID=630683 RepID=A0A9Q0EIV6_9TELE|nr:hypothetical protein NHX12_024782 [Muraenolepis orangiensis]